MSSEKQRVITAAIGLPFLLLFLWLGGAWLAGLLVLLGLIGGYEYCRLLQTTRMRQPAMWYLCCLVYIAAGFLAFYGVRVEEGTAWLLIVIWSTDIAAYEYGRRFGRHKLAPTISPHKTVEGAVAGIVAAIVLGSGYAAVVMGINFMAAFAVSLLISVLGQVGDLIESHAKRLAGVKDSGKLLPGHGGVLDRFDSILFASMFMYLLLKMLRR